jgi:hypothetical protein
MELKILIFRCWLVAVVLVLISFTSNAEFNFDRGEPDNNRHPNVGWITAFDKNGLRLGNYCSGTLISERVFLTASHCTIAIHDRRVGDPEFDGFQVYVGFTNEFLNVGESIDSISDKSQVFLVESVHTNPDYDFFIMSPQPERADIAVAILTEAPQLTPALLPYKGELNDLRKAKMLQETIFPAVGFGATDVIIPPKYDGAPWNWFETGQFRYVGYTSFKALHPTYMILSMNFSTGDSGPCYGDSGGPIFLGETEKVVAITVWGDIMCRAMTAPLRLDTDGARAFLGQFGVALP